MSLNVNLSPKCGTVSIANGSSTGGANLTAFTYPAYSLQLTETSGHAVTCKLNGSANAVFPIAASATVLIPLNSLGPISSIDFANASGSAASVTYIAGLGAY